MNKPCCLAVAWRRFAPADTSPSAATLPSGPNTAYAAGGSTALLVDSDSGDILFIEYGDKYLKLNGSRITTSYPDTVFGDTSLVGIYDLGASSDEIIMVTSSDRTSSHLPGMMLSQDQGVTWASMMGNWPTVMGDYWAGSVGDFVPRAKYMHVTG